MKGFHVDESPFHIDIPTYNFATSEAFHQHGTPFKEEEEDGISPHEYQRSQSFSSSKSMSKFSSFAEEIRDKRPEIDGSLCIRSMEGDHGHGYGHVGDLQASMEAIKGTHMCVFNNYMDMERDYGSHAQASIAPTIGGHLGRLKVPKGSTYVDDLQASMVALSCNSPSENTSFWSFLPSNYEESSTDSFSSDEFRMYEFKVRRCMRGRSHDWTECPFVHPGEKARRRDPRRFHYSGMACPDFRRGTCRRGDACELSHGVFECWLHPARYRTQLCKDNKFCKRRVCFFAHSASQLRFVSPDSVPNHVFALKSPVASPRDAMESFNGLSVDDIHNHIKPNRSHDHSAHYYTPLRDGSLLFEGSHGHCSYPYTPSNPPSDGSSLKASVNLRNQLALSSLTSNIDQILSPTSTLIGHVFSPPPLSPPLSPSESPPMSLGIAFSSRSTALSRKIASLSSQPLSKGLASAIDANIIPSGAPLANLAHSNSALLLSNTSCGPSPLSITSLLGDDEHDHLDRPSSLPDCIKSKELNVDDMNFLTASMEARPANAMAHSISTLQQMETRLAMMNMDVKNARRPYMSHNSNPNTPTSRDADCVTSHQRVESGQGLGSSIYGKLGRGGGLVDMENPDLGWVNELVK